ncbi:hypothetical protein JW960_06945 [candidate division KSB1 bacterium]|nr:hypothetical protein [candidate division KSB1 bacterium]
MGQRDAIAPSDGISNGQPQNHFEFSITTCTTVIQLTQQTVITRYHGIRPSAEPVEVDTFTKLGRFIAFDTVRAANSSSTPLRDGKLRQRHNLYITNKLILLTKLDNRTLAHLLINQTPQFSGENCGV